MPDTRDTITFEHEVTEADTAESLDPDLPSAASTPYVLSIAELACHRLMSPHLDDGQVTVGTKATIRHLAPTAVGSTLTTVAALVERDGRKLRYEVQVTDNGRTVATIEHDRVIVERAQLEAMLG